MGISEKGKKENEMIAVRVGSQGRIVVPQTALRERGIKEGDIVLLSIRKAVVKEEKENGKNKS